MQNQNIQTSDTPKFGRAARSGLLALIYLIDQELKHVPAKGTALERTLWENLNARIAEVEKLTGPLQLVTSLGLQFLRGQVRGSLLKLEGLGTDYRRRYMVAHLHRQSAFWWGMERSSRFWVGDNEEWKGNLYQLLDHLNDSANGLTPEERSLVNIEPSFLNGILGSALNDLPPGFVTGVHLNGVFFETISPEWIWIIKHSAVTAATV